MLSVTVSFQSGDDAPVALFPHWQDVMHAIRDRSGGAAQKRTVGWAVVSVALVGLTLVVLPNLNGPGESGSTTSPAATVDATPPSPDTNTVASTGVAVATVGVSMMDQVTAGVTNAAASDVEQAVAVIDRTTGRLIAGHAGDVSFNSESITKLFTVAYYLIQVDGTPGTGLADDLRSLIQESNDTVQIDLWRPDIIPTIAARYQLTGTSNSPAESPDTWGSDQITANDAATFLNTASQDPLVGPRLLAWMAGTPPTGADGFNQLFGFNALTGNHGSKQGWSDPGWSPANLHSVGFTDRYFAAVLQTSPTATYATMRSTSTTTARLITAATL